MTSFERHYTRDDRAESVYQYLVVEVPAGAPAITVRLDYDRADAVVDLGLIGPDRFGGCAHVTRSSWTGSSQRKRIVLITERIRMKAA